MYSRFVSPNTIWIIWLTAFNVIIACCQSVDNLHFIWINDTIHKNTHCCWINRNNPQSFSIHTIPFHSPDFNAACRFVCEFFFVNPVWIGCFVCTKPNSRRCGGAMKGCYSHNWNMHRISSVKVAFVLLPLSCRLFGLYAVGIDSVVGINKARRRRRRSLIVCVSFTQKIISFVLQTMVSEHVL